MGASPRPSAPTCLPAYLAVGQGRGALIPATLLDTATAKKKRGRRAADGAKPDFTNRGVAAWTTAWQDLATDGMELTPYRPADRRLLASGVPAVNMGPVAVWPGHLLPPIPPCNRGPANQQQHLSRKNSLLPSCCTVLWQRSGGMEARARSTTMARHQSHQASQGHRTVFLICGAKHCADPLVYGTRTKRHNPRGANKGNCWYCRR